MPVHLLSEFSNDPLSITPDIVQNGVRPLEDETKLKPTSRWISRVSTEEQPNEAQLIELKAAGCHTIFEEQGSGASRARPVLAKLLRD
jgi:hypothetical protein